MQARLPSAFVLGLAFLLLLVTFRSRVVPLKAIVLNLLSVGAAYGVLVLVFQDGRLESLLGFGSNGGITSCAALPLRGALRAVHGLPRLHPAPHPRAVGAGLATDRAVAHGIKATAGVVTSAAGVMVAVFSVFATLTAIEFKQIGLGLAVAVLIDATLVRAVKLPRPPRVLSAQAVARQAGRHRGGRSCPVRSGR